MVALADRPTSPAVVLDELGALVRNAVSLRLGWFEQFPDITEDDLVQLGMIRALKVHAKYNPRWAYSTYIYRCVFNCLRDVLRGRARETGRIQAVAGMAPTTSLSLDALAEIRDWYESSQGQGLPGGAGGDDETLEEWLAKVYKFARGVFPERTGSRGPIGYTRAQRVTVALLMRRRGLSVRGARLLMLECPELAEAVGLTPVPQHKWFFIATRTTAEYLLAG